MEQLVYCHALHRSQYRLNDLTQRVQRASHKVTAASQSGLFTTKKLFRPFLQMEALLRPFFERT